MGSMGSSRNRELERRQESLIAAQERDLAKREERAAFDKVRAEGAAQQQRDRALRSAGVQTLSGTYAGVGADGASRTSGIGRRASGGKLGKGRSSRA